MLKVTLLKNGQVIASANVSSISVKKNRSVMFGIIPGEPTDELNKARFEADEYIIGEVKE